MEGLRQWKPKKPKLASDDIVCFAMLVIFVVVMIWGQYAS